MNRAKKAGFLAATFAIAALTALGERQNILDWSVEHGSPRTAVFAAKALGADSQKALSKAVWNDSAAQVKFAARTLHADIGKPQNEWYSLTSARGFERPGTWNADHTMLMDAASIHRTEAVKALVELGADGKKALYAALDDPRMLKGLIDAGVDPAIDGGNLLYGTVHTVDTRTLSETLWTLTETGRFTDKLKADALNEGLRDAVSRNDTRRAHILLQAGASRADAIAFHRREYSGNSDYAEMGRFLKSDKIVTLSPHI